MARDLPNQLNSFEKITRLIGLVLLAPILALATIPVAVHISQKSDFGFAVHKRTIQSVVPQGPADMAGLMPGDFIVRINDHVIPNMVHYYVQTAGNYDQTPTVFLIERNNRQHTLTAVPRPPGQLVMTSAYSLWVSGLGFLVIGWWVFYRRKDLVARNFFALCLMFAFLLLDIPDLPRLDYMTVKENLRTLLQLLLPAYFLRFFLQFPSPKLRPGGSLNRWRVLLFPGWIIFVSSVLLESFSSIINSEQLSQALDVLALIYSLGFFIAGLYIFSRRIMRRDRPIQRTKMFVILAGLLAGLVPFLAAMIIGNLNPGSSLPQWQYLSFSLLLVPISFGLSIMRYGALDKPFVLRISLIYGVLTLLVLGVYFVVVMGVGQLLARLFSVSTYPVLLLVVAATSLTILPLRRIIQTWIDNTFYPGRRTNRQAIRDLGQSLTSVIDPELVKQNLLQGLMDLFHPEKLTLFFSKDNQTDQYTAFQEHLSHISVNEAGLNIKKDSSLALLLNRLRRPVFAEEVEDILFSGEADTESLSLLTRAKINLLVPLISANRLLGFLAFGPKKGGSLYSQEDLSHLNDFSLQAGSLLESRLLYKDSLQRKRTETELELARNIQHGLLPSEPLEDECFVIAGRQESCRKVGGDYFDYFLRKDGTLGFALADVCGKGIPAALHMTSLRVAFRQEADAEDLPHLVIKRLNNTVFKLVAPEQFICFFYGIWNPVSGVLSYCNAGSEQPILSNPDRRYNQYLSKGGPVLGVMEDFDYLQGSLLLEPKDRLFLYTDGLTDEQNPEDEFFDLTRLQDHLHKNREDTPTELLGKIFSAINAFGGPDRTDDKTAISLEIKKLK
ncbi:MAG: SpoIIE family protein phosphatase [bacterium]|nr:SpoIIE family protein phosphatase [bacterium]